MATPTTLPASFVSGAVLTAAQMNNLRGAFRILQVVSTTKTDTFTASGVALGAASDITGLTATITPSATSSLVLCFFTVHGSANYTGLVSNQAYAIGLYRGTTLIGQGAAASNRTRVTAQGGAMSGTTTFDGHANVNGHFLDNPATTSSTTYKLSFINASQYNATMNVYANRTVQDTDNNFTSRPASTLTVMEISA